MSVGLTRLGASTAAMPRCKTLLPLRSTFPAVPGGSYFNSGDEQEPLSGADISSCCPTDVKCFAVAGEETDAECFTELCRCLGTCIGVTSFTTSDVRPGGCVA
ncbi:hypothetical protein NDU88_007487 [Pleurodeles waltl]|uniref:Uncharacterized protein n=1 Tax=Pleurodeles waltl TaxID=8319 RepID=A0AAV7NT87_PLEWA|nr:hypothetical protein NDU88_007487 [Pleurodeles waltl]